VDRRQFLFAASAALGLSPLAAWAGRSGASTNDMSSNVDFPVQKTDAEWQQELSPEQGTARPRDRALVHEPAERGEARRHVRVRGLRPGPVLVGHEVRERDGVAELLQAA
jgi:hypothetical protein